MDIKDYKKIKSKYGERFAKFCRSNFPTLSQDHSIFDIVSSLFYPNRFLLDDLQKNEKTQDFVNYVNSRFLEQNSFKPTDLSPFVLMKKAGYTLYKCEDYYDVMKFKKFWPVKDEVLCTFDDAKRAETHHVFFAIKDGATLNGINGKKRSDFINPKRQDEYGTSVISIQFPKQKYTTVSIKNRYNHTVSNADSAFDNNLDFIIPGLSYSFCKYLDVSLNLQKTEFEMKDYTMANDGRFYKYNYDVNSIKFCPNNIVIKNGKVYGFDKSRYELVDYFLIDKKKKKVFNFEKDDCFTDGLKHIKKIDTRNISNMRVITITFKNNSTAKIIVNKHSQIIGYFNNNISKIGDEFLSKNKLLRFLHLPNVEKIGNYFLCNNKELQYLNLKNVKDIKNKFLYNNKKLKNINFENLIKAGDRFLFCNEELKELCFKNLKKVGIDFAYYNQIASKASFPNLEHIEGWFLNFNECLESLELPSAKIIKQSFLCRNQRLKKLSCEKVKTVGSCFLLKNKQMEELSLPIALKIGTSFMDKNDTLKKLYIPNLKQKYAQNLNDICNEALGFESIK